jgi:hypothetical protein
MGHSCGCGHCACDENNSPDDEKKASIDISDAEALASQKIKELEKEIESLGYKVEETPEGDIKISE